MSSIINSVKHTIAENLTQNVSLPKQEQFSLDSIPSLSNKTALVTGGSEGIGLGCSTILLEKDINKLLIISKRPEQQTEAQQSLSSQFPNKKDSIKFIQCDLTDWKECKSVASSIAKEEPRLDIVILNAGRGIMTWEKDSHGIDRHMSANVIGHSVLTSYLLPLLTKTAKTQTVRITTQASNLHESAPKDTKFDSIDELQHELGPNEAYGRSKLGNILYARYLSRHLNNPNILVNATHPGIVDTNLSNNVIHQPFPVLGYGMSHLMKPFKKDIIQGAVSTMFAATTTKETGQYICCPAIYEPGSELSRNEEIQDNMMNLIEKIIKKDVGLELCTHIREEQHVA